MVFIWPLLAGGEKKKRLYNRANLHVCVEIGLFFDRIDRIKFLADKELKFFNFSDFCY